MTARAPRPWTHPVQPLVLAAVVLAGVLMAVQERPARSDEAVPAWTRSLRFLDQSGAIRVVDAESDRELALLEGEQGFARGVLRTLVRERRMRQLDARRPFELRGGRDGSLMLVDPATGARIHLDSFGQTQKEAFARFGPTAVAARSTPEGNHP
jgi:putative photosynthetic complex assembly protein